MKILFASSSYYPHINGVYYFVCRLGPMLQAKGHTIAVIAPSASTKASFGKIDNLDVFGIPSFSIIINPSIRPPIPFLLKSRVRKIIENFKPDIIHVQDHFPLCKAIIEVNKILKIPIMGSNHFMPENFTFLFKKEYVIKTVDKYLWKSFSKIFNQVNLVTTPTETGAQLIRRRLKVDAIAISSGIDLETFNPYGDTKEIKAKYFIPDKPVLLYVGRLDPEKHIEEIFEAVAIAVKKIDFCFVIVGKGTSKIGLEKLAAKLGISNNLIFTGFVPDDELPFFYKLSRCFIIASIAELLSLGTLQAMASALPVIAVNAGALGELVKDNVNGYLYNEGAIAEIVRSIEDLITSDKIHKRMSEKSLEFARAHDINKTAEAFEKLYQQQTGKS